MLDPKERAEKIRNAPNNTTRVFHKLTPEEREQRIKNALEREKHPGLSSSDEYAFLRNTESSGK